MQEAVASELKPDYDWLIAAHQLLRLHGKTLCKPKYPKWPECPPASNVPPRRASSAA